MSKPLRALIVEDAADDADLLVRELERGGFEVTFERVDTPEALAEALDRTAWDILFADYTMPGFSGTEALELVRSGGHDLPFVFVSGTIGEDVAVDAMRAGADDYVIKGNLKRLVPAVARELRDAAVRQERERIAAEREAAEEALRVSQERHRLLFENIADAILVFDRRGEISFASASVRDVLGYEPEQLAGRLSLELVHPEDASTARRSFARVTERGGALPSVEVRMRHRDGSWRPMDCVLRNLLHEPHILGVVVTCRDVTERKRLEAEFLQAQKLESVGRLAGGIAHDFNNVLTAVLGHVDLMLADPSLGESHRSDLGEIKRSANRAAALTRQLLAFSRRQVLDLRPLDLSEVVGSMIPMLERLLGGGIEIRAKAAPGLGTVRADPGQIEQVLLNLAVNARDAMPQGGTLTIETTNVDLDASYAELHPSTSPGAYVRVEVGDTGAGMDAATLAHIFEPFFTTKGVNEGTGLGLATVYGIVKQSGGNIWVYSEPGHGTSFKIHLPRVDEPARGLRPAGEPGPTPRGTETVLVVEDERAIRNLVVRVLRALGYRVLEADGAEEAMVHLADRSQAIDILLSDAVLPKVGGKELARRATSQRPGLPVLFMSGHATPVLNERGILDPGVELVQKPFSPASLARKVRAVLDAARKRP